MKIIAWKDGEPGNKAMHSFYTYIHVCMHMIVFTVFPQWHGGFRVSARVLIFLLILCFLRRSTAKNIYYTYTGPPDFSCIC